MTFIDQYGKKAEIELTDKETETEITDEFFDVGGLRYDYKNQAYIVNDVEYLIDQAWDAHYATGDYYSIDDKYCPDIFVHRYY